ncbi:MAG: hypothetical protein D6732_25585 [Methanobacteriota archaeon]|nr:MAG: hypothetical protein D6732_25585 [Euryarchaeota archaeon]
MHLAHIFIPRKPKLVIFMFFFILVLAFPYALNFDKVGKGSTDNLIGESSSSEIPVFFEGTNDLIVLLTKSDGTILTEDVKNWTEFFKFELDKEFTDFIEFREDKLDIFWLGNTLLSSYLRNIQLALIGLNLSYFVLIEQTGQILQQFFEGMESNRTFEDLLFQYRTDVNQTIAELQSKPLGVFVTDLVEVWFTSIEDNLQSWMSIQASDFKDFVSQIRDMIPSPRSLFGNSPISDFAEVILEKFEFGDLITSNEFFLFSGNLLLGNSDNPTIAFLKDTYANGNLIYPIQLAREKIISFLNREYVPIGFNETILDLYLSLYSDFDPNTGIANRILIRVPLVLGITPEETNDLIESLKSMDLVDDLQSLGVKISFLNIAGMAHALEIQFQEDLSIIDLVATVSGFALFYFLFRKISYSILAISINVFSLLVIRGILVIFLVGFLNPTQVDMMISSVIIYGAGLNYSIFLMFRFFEAIEETDIDAAIQTCLEKAGHSIMISSTAVVLSLIPLTFSRVPLFRSISTLTIVGLLIQLMAILLIFPSFFLIIADRLKTPSISKTKISPKRVLLLNPKSLILTVTLMIVLSILVLSNFIPKSSPNDFVSLDEEQSLALQEIYEGFEESVFSQVIVSMQAKNDVIFENGSLNLPLISEVGELSGEFVEIAFVRQILSAAWPLGSPVDFFNESLGLIYKETAIASSKQFINGNITYILVSLQKSDNQIDLIEPVKKIEEISRKFSSFSNLTFLSITGFIPSVAKLNQRMLEDAPPKFLLSIVLLSVFLAIIFQSVVQVPLRLLSSVFISATVSLAITSVVSNVFFGFSLNLGVFVFSVFILFAFAIDFDVYLFSRFLEERKQIENPRIALSRAMNYSGLSIRSSGLLMLASFSSLFFSTFPILIHAGLILVVSIFFDTFILRTYLFPGLLLIRIKHFTR